MTSSRDLKKAIQQIMKDLSTPACTVRSAKQPYRKSCRARAFDYWNWMYKRLSIGLNEFTSQHFLFQGRCLILQ